MFLEKYTDTNAVLNTIDDIKMLNKQRFIRETGLNLDPNSIFDVQIKRIHMYKRQIMNVLRIRNKRLEMIY